MILSRSNNRSSLSTETFACPKGLVNLVLPEVKRFLLHTGEHYENRYSLYNLMETDSASCLSSSETLKDLKKY